jgi:hypothetical protein
VGEKVILYGMNATRFMRPVGDSNRFLSMLTTINFSVKKKIIGISVQIKETVQMGD